MSQPDSFELETIREFLSNYCGEMGVNYLENTNKQPNNSEFAERLRNYQLKYGHTGFNSSEAP